ncbi:MAG TPA: hypothetical protein VMX17_12190 [Candidatus Glassbacteria bacterium]|nr:hypothetical protein [Candidatus Glassbacteria bacterium]
MKYISVKDLILGQFEKGKFRKYDILIRYLFVKKYYGTGQKDNFKYNLYSQLAMVHGTKDRTKSFIRLIKSFSIHGYDDKYPLTISDDLHICGGTHRIGICLHLGISEVPYITKNVCRRKRRRFTKSWLKENGFKERMSRISRAKKELFKDIGITG